MGCPCSDAADYISIRQERPGDLNYSYGHDGIESMGLSAEAVVERVIKDLGLTDSPIGQAVRREIVRAQFVEAERRVVDAILARDRLKDEMGLNG